MTFCFGPALALAVWLAIQRELRAGHRVIAAMLFGLAYFPMAFPCRCHPRHRHVPPTLGGGSSILKVPAEYFVTLLVLGGVYSLSGRWGTFWLGILFPEGFSTHSMGALFGMLGAHVFWAFISHLPADRGNPPARPALCHPQAKTRMARALTDLPIAKGPSWRKFPCKSKWV